MFIYPQCIYEPRIQYTRYINVYGAVAKYLGTGTEGSSVVSAGQTFVEQAVGVGVTLTKFSITYNG